MPGPEYLTRMAPLDPARVRDRLAELEARVGDRLAELEREHAAQILVVDRLGEILDAEQRELDTLHRRLGELRAHPAVAQALEPYPDPGGPWLWAESLAGRDVIASAGRTIVLQMLQDRITGRLWIAPLGTEPPDGDRLRLARLVIDS
jgi:hypothetical protein